MDNFLGFGIVEAVNKATKDREWLTRLILWFFIFAAGLWVMNYAIVPSLQGLLGIISPSPGWLASVANFVAFPLAVAALSSLGMKIVNSRELSKARKQRDEIYELRGQVDGVLENVLRRDRWFDSSLRTFAKDLTSYSSVVMEFAAAIDDPVLKGRASSIAENARRIKESVESYFSDDETTA